MLYARQDKDWIGVIKISGYKIPMGREGIKRVLSKMCSHTVLDVPTKNG